MPDVSIDSIDYHRNGSDGAGYYVAIATTVDDDGQPRRFLVIQFPDADDLGYGPDGATAAIDLDLAAAGLVSSDVNAWRARSMFGQAVRAEAARWAETLRQGRRSDQRRAAIRADYAVVEAKRAADAAAAGLAEAQAAAQAARAALLAADD